MQQAERAIGPHLQTGLAVLRDGLKVGPAFGGHGARLPALKHTRGHRDHRCGAAVAVVVGIVGHLDGGVLAGGQQAQHSRTHTATQRGRHTLNG